MGFTPEQLGLAQEEDLDGDPGAVGIVVENVALGGVVGDDLLLFHRFLDILDLVADLSRPLKFQVGAGLGHFLGQTLLDLLDISVQKFLDFLDLGRVLSLGHLAPAGPQALAHVVVKAWPARIARAVAQGKDLLDELQSRLSGVDVGIRAKIIALVLAHNGGQLGLGVPFIGDFDVWIARPVFQGNVIVGLVLLDQGNFQQKGFLI